MNPEAFAIGVEDELRVKEFGLPKKRQPPGLIGFPPADALYGTLDEREAMLLSARYCFPSENRRWVTAEDMIRAYFGIGREPVSAVGLGAIIDHENPLSGQHSWRLLCDGLRQAYAVMSSGVRLPPPFPRRPWHLHPPRRATKEAREAKREAKRAEKAEARRRADAIASGMCPDHGVKVSRGPRRRSYMIERAGTDEAVRVVLDLRWIGLCPHCGVLPDEVPRDVIPRLLRAWLRPKSARLLEDYAAGDPSVSCRFDV